MNFHEYSPAFSARRDATKGLMIIAGKRLLALMREVIAGRI